MRVVAPWLKSSWTFNDKYYVIPNMDAVVIGGTNQKYDWNSEVCSCVVCVCEQLHVRSADGSGDTTVLILYHIASIISYTLEI